MRPFVIAAIVSCAVLTNVVAKESPQVQAENARYKAEVEATLKRINGAHVERLRLLLKSLTTAGDLDAALVVRERIKEIEGAPTAIASSSGAPTPSSDATAPTGPSTESSPVPTGVAFFEGKWTLVKGNDRKFVSFGKKGHFSSGMNAWGDLEISRKGDKVTFTPDKVFQIVNRNLLQGLDPTGKPTAETIERVMEPAGGGKSAFGDAK